ncbi:MAG TPA: LytTR family DNA-binding domain-containing protein [Gemmatimonadaceae bacterium]|nr:LytTR family DNA-binding domain-containing protein [Gemmatimonadaceae bacterium]
MNNVTTIELGRTERRTASSTADGGFARTFLFPSLRRNADALKRWAGATNGGPIDERGRFWILQVVFWPAYGVILMVPWFGIFTVSSMIPNKLMVAGTGMLAGLCLRPVLRFAHGIGGVHGRLLGLLSIVVVGVAWDLGLSLLVGQSVRVDLQRLGSASGVPTLAGGFYHILVLAVWAMAWLLFRGKQRATTEAVRAPSSEAIVFRDGRTSHIFAPDEIDWVGADGDYVVLHAGKRRVMVRATLGGTEARLPASDYLRIHRSSIVRVQSVRELHPRANNELDVVLRDGTRLRASRSYSDRLRAAMTRIDVSKIDGR